jgi:formate hydrogenlyase subunit 6/NADH:ubiquinone oxidoreductase subunit I
MSKRYRKSELAVKEKMAKQSQDEMVRINFMGAEYKVPRSLTIMKALEYVGHQLTRGAGCRCGFCGACTTVYRVKGNHKIQAGLACQTLVEDGMYLTQLPFSPADKPKWNIEELEPNRATMLQFFPEIAKCISCNTCTKTCPQDIQVMDVVQHSLRGDIKKAAELSFDCIFCGMCAQRCPASIVQYNVGILARRLYGCHLIPRDPTIKTRIQEIKDGKFDQELEQLKNASRDELSQLYAQREKEP